MTRKQWKARRVHKNVFLRQFMADLVYVSIGLALGTLTMLAFVFLST